MSAGKVIFGIVVAAAIGFGIYAAIGIKMLMRICFSMGKYKLRSWDFQFVNIDFELVLYNPSALEATLRNYDFNLYLNNKWVANIKSDVPVRIVAEGSTTLVLPVKLDYKKTFGLAGSKEILAAFSLKQYDKIFVTLKGNYTGVALKIPVKLAVEEKWTLQSIVDEMSKPSVPCGKAA